jgi:hypothetical protein
MKRCGMVQGGEAWHEEVWHSMRRCGTTQGGAAWHREVQCGMRMEEEFHMTLSGP